MAKQQATTPSSQLNVQTMTFLGISQQPFVDRILAGNEIYSDPSRDQVVSTLKHHMQFSDLLLIVEGEQGSGKTTLFRQLIQDKIPNLFVMSVLAEPTDTLVQLQQKMSVHLKNQGSANYLDQDLKNLQVFDQVPIAIIDDAHVLSDTTLQELIRYRSQLKRDKDTTLKLVLLANPGMSKTIETISDLQHNQRYVQQMPDLTQKQTQGFIDDRLIKSGYKGGTVLEPETILQIQKKSKGNPGKTMQLATLMLEKHVRNLDRVNSSWLPKVALAGVLLLVGVGAFVFWQQSNDSGQAETVDGLLDADTMNNAAEESALTEDSSMDVASIPEADVTVTADVAAATASEPDAATSEPLTDAGASSGIAPPLTVPVEATVGTKPPLTTESLPGKPEAKLAAVPVMAAKTEVVSPLPVSATSPVIVAEPKLTPVPTLNYSKQIADMAAMGVQDQGWLLTQNKQHWSLQVLAASDLLTLVKFSQEHKLGSDAAWYQANRNGKPWFVLVYRFYTTADAARKGLELLPPDLQAAQPWVKGIAAIHKDLSSSKP